MEEDWPGTVPALRAHQWPPVLGVQERYAASGERIAAEAAHQAHRVPAEVRCAEVGCGLHTPEGERSAAEAAHQADRVPAEVSCAEVGLSATQMKGAANGRVSSRPASGTPDGQHMMPCERRQIEPAVDRQ